MGPLLFVSMVFASDVGDKEVLQVLESKPSERRLHTSTPMSSQETIESSPSRGAGGNLPGKLSRGNAAYDQASETLVVRPRSGVKSHAIPVTIGDIFDCRIYQDIIGYMGSVSPVRAEIASGPYKGYLFVGNATMDPKTKNLLVQFHKIRSPNGVVVVNITATVHSSSGELGLKGTVTSHYWQFFFASVLASAAEGYAEATVQRQRDFFGQFQNTPTVENAGKTGVAKGASQTAEIMADKMKSAPEYTTVRGPIHTKIFIIDDIKTQEKI